MTKSRSIQQAASKTLRKARDAKSTKGADPTELILSELKLRRERLQQLLNMIHMEAVRADESREPLSPRHKCAATKRNSNS